MFVQARDDLEAILPEDRDARVAALQAEVEAAVRQRG